MNVFNQYTQVKRKYIIIFISILFGISSYSQKNEKDISISILNKNIAEQDTLELIIINHSNQKYFLPIDFKHKGYYTNKYWTHEYTESPTFELMPEDSLEYELKKHLFGTKTTTSPTYFTPYFKKSFYPTIEVHDSIGTIIKREVIYMSHETSVLEEYYFFERDTANFFTSVYNFTLLKPNSTTYIKLPFNTKIYGYKYNGEKEVRGWYNFEKNSTYTVSLWYKVNHCEELEKRIPIHILEQLEKQGYHCYDKMLETKNTIPLILNID